MKFNIKTVSEMNTREHWTKRNKRKKAQQQEFMVAWRSGKFHIDLPATIVFVRHSVNMMDADNLAGSFKHCQDQLARELKIDDGDRAQVRWKYEQVKLAKREHYFTIEVQLWEDLR